MATMMTRIATSDLKVDLMQKVVLEDPDRLETRYDERADIVVLTLTFHSEEDEERYLGDAIVHYIDGDVALIFDPVSKQIVGLHIDNFFRSYVPKHKEMRELAFSGITGEPSAAPRRKMVDLICPTFVPAAPQLGRFCPC